jgi:hypothetical protein
MTATAAVQPMTRPAIHAWLFFLADEVVMAAAPA